MVIRNAKVLIEDQINFHHLTKIEIKKVDDYLINAINEYIFEPSKVLELEISDINVDHEIHLSHFCSLRSLTIRGIRNHLNLNLFLPHLKNLSFLNLHYDVD